MSFWNTPSNVTLKQQHRWLVSFGNNGADAARDANQPLKATLYSHFVKSVDKPTFSIKTTQAKYLYSHTFNFPTRVVWNPIKITFYDFFDNDNSLKLGRLPIRTVDSTEEIKTAHFSMQLFFDTFLQRSGYVLPYEGAQENKLLRFRSYNFKNGMVQSLVGNQDYNVNPNFYEKTKTGNTFIDTENKTENIGRIFISELDSSGKQLEAWNIFNPLITDISYDKLDYSNDAPTTITVTIAYDWATLYIESDKDSQGNVVKVPIVTPPPPPPPPPPPAPAGNTKSVLTQTQPQPKPESKPVTKSEPKPAEKKKTPKASPPASRTPRDTTTGGRKKIFDPFNPSQRSTLPIERTIGNPGRLPTVEDSTNQQQSSAVKPVKPETLIDRSTGGMQETSRLRSISKFLTGILYAFEL
jgi:hypothetical protein